MYEGVLMSTYARTTRAHTATHHIHTETHIFPLTPVPCKPTPINS
jgi:hypothetical protein